MDIKDFDRQSVTPADAVRSLMQPLRAPKVWVPPPDANLASEFHKRLLKWINDFDADLDQEHQVGVRLVSFGQTVVFRITDITYWNPSLLGVFGVTEDGSPVELIQHVTQISILLMKLPRKDPSKPKHPLGFAPEPEESKEEGE